ncbi:stage II sporulation protein M [Candidatus Woesearchaeota archaeon]|nr:stage II sporulation protein M [Candidatus Woesearchaeota archaeon]
MVLESLISPLKAEKKPWEMFFIGLLYSSVGIFLSLWIFKDQASLVMVFLTVMACVPIVYATMKLEEKKDMEIDEERILLKEHNKAISFLMFLFLGITISCTLWYVFLPQDTFTSVFDKQIATIQAVNSQVTGQTINQFTILTKIFFNNLKVLSFAILFSFIFGAGAIFILTWNATVIGAAMGNFVKGHIADYAFLLGFSKTGIYFQAISLSFLRYAIHGIPEILAYFYGALAGGIISVAIARHHYKSKHFSTILFDVSELLIIAVSFLLIAALIEVFITPILF